MVSSTTSLTGVSLIHAMSEEPLAFLLSPEALEFLAQLHRQFDPQRRQLLARRVERQRIWDQGASPDFLPETASIRESSWTVAPLPLDLADRRVEITGPTDRKMIINALNSGANVFMADFEDSNCPTWDNMILGQQNLYDAVRGTITYDSPDGRHYRLNPATAVLMVRPRGWHLEERLLWVDSQPISASLFDFGLYFFHNAHALISKGTGPYFYLPKFESHLEARLWNAVFVRAQELLGIPVGTIKATVLIETLPAAFEMDEILYELRDHSAGLNCGRWDYIFSCMKTMRNHHGLVFADRANLTMASPFMRAYSQLLIQTCHRRRAHAMGGMSAYIPIRDNPDANNQAVDKVRQDKLREVTDGHDGTWVAHPGLVPVAKTVFDEVMPHPNQIEREVAAHHHRITAEDLRRFAPNAPLTEQGLRTNIRVGLRYVAAWLNGNGCVPIDHLMEDAATAEISRTQIWQWIHSPKGVLDDGRKVTPTLFRKLLAQEQDQLMRHDAGVPQHIVQEAVALFDRVVTQKPLVDFLTLPGYDLLMQRQALQSMMRV